MGQMRIFGTDGVRGLANGQLTGELALGLGVAAARVLVEHGGLGSGRQRPLAVVGRDTRISGQFLEHAVVAGVSEHGDDFSLTVQETAPGEGVGERVQTDPVAEPVEAKDIEVEDGLGGHVDEQTDKVGASMRL